MNSEVVYIATLIGALIGGGFALLGSVLQHYLSLREDKTKREREKLEREAHERRENIIKGVKVPILGDIVAGEPLDVGHESFSSYDEEDAIEISQAMLDENRTDDLFALRVMGDSMIDAMVNDGDIVIMRQQESAHDGEMVAVWLTPDDTTTLKYFYNEGEYIRLQPANPMMESIRVNRANVRVQGKVMMVLRNTA